MPIIARMPARNGRRHQPGVALRLHSPTIEDNSEQLRTKLQKSRKIRNAAARPLIATRRRILETIANTEAEREGRILRRASSVPLSPPSPSLFRDEAGNARKQDRDGFWEDSGVPRMPQLSPVDLSRTERLSMQWRRSPEPRPRRKNSIGIERQRTFPRSPYTESMLFREPASAAPGLLPMKPSLEFEAWCKRAGWQEMSDEPPERDGRVGRCLQEKLPMQSSVSQLLYEKSMALARWQLPQHQVLGWKKDVPVEEALVHRPLQGCNSQVQQEDDKAIMFLHTSEPLMQTLNLENDFHAADYEEPEGLLVIRNLSRRVKAEKLRETFEKHGEVVDVHIPFDKVLDRNREFAFVKMARISEAERAREELDGTTLGKQDIEVVLGHERRVQTQKYLQVSLPDIGTEDSGFVSPADTCFSMPSVQEESSHACAVGTSAATHTGMTPREVKL